MLANFSTLDPRSIYDTLRLETLKLKAKLEKLQGAEKEKFKKQLDKKIKQIQLKEVSQQLSSIFINMMFKSMRKNVDKYRLIPKNPAENIFKDMLFQEYSLKIAKDNKFGLAKMIYEQYSKYL